MKPKVITICGSSRFCDIMAVCAWILERDENAITLSLHLLPSWYCNVASHLAEHQGVATSMDELHLRKIDAADEVFIVNHDDYIGESTKREVQYAIEQGKKLRWYTHDLVGQYVNNLVLDSRRTERE